MSKETDSLLKELKELDEASSLNAPLPGIAFRMEPMIQVTAGRLKVAVENNPSHPVAAAYRKSTRNVPDGLKLNVGRVDLQCLLENRIVVVEESKQEIRGKLRTVTTKKVGESYPRKQTNQAEKSPPPKSHPEKETPKPS